MSKPKWQEHEDGRKRHKNQKNVMKNMAERIAKVAGVEEIKGFNLEAMFSEVLKKNSEDEVEEYFTVGTASTTPDIKDVDTNWSKPWVFFRTLV